MAFVNILEIVYPVGSIYISTAAVSPSELIGGTWTQIQGALLGFTGSNDFADSMNYGGSLKISVNQLPSHTHNYIKMTSRASWSINSGSGGLYNGSSQASGATGGGRIICPIIFLFMDGIASRKRGDIDGLR